MRLAPVVSLVIVSWNVRDYLIGCIESIRRSSLAGQLEVWVVDNASADGTVGWIHDNAPEVHLIANQHNSGFARANNQAIVRCSGRYTLILNPDTVLVGDALEVLVTHLERHPDIGMVGPLLVRESGEPDAACARRLGGAVTAVMTDVFRLHSLPIVGPRIARRLYWPYGYDTARPVEAVSGAAMMVRTDLLQRLRGFDERYLHCGEDLDLCKRISEAGFGVQLEPSARIVHYGGRSSSQELARSRTTVESAISVARYLQVHHGTLAAKCYEYGLRCIASPRIALGSLVRMSLGQLPKAECRARIRTAWSLACWRRI
jgi:N-acetylglucosaminyl-diphospho-decaprenol L-rhamnosyltransferase